MTTMAGNGPLPSGSARNPLTSSLPDLKVISFVFTPAFTGEAASATQANAAARTRALRMVLSSSTVQAKTLFPARPALPGRLQPSPRGRPRPEAGPAAKVPGRVGRIFEAHRAPKRWA